MASARQLVLRLALLVWPAAAHSVDGMTPDKYIGGIPVYNYQGDAGLNSGGSPEWVVILKDGAKDDDVKISCDDGEDKCIYSGHPGQGGLGFTVMKSSEQQLAEIVKKHPDSIDLIEPSLPVYLPPHEHQVTEEESPLNAFGMGSEVIPDPEAEDPEVYDHFPFSNLERNRGVFCMCIKLGKVTGKGPGCDDSVYRQMENQCDVVMMTQAQGFQDQKCKGPCTQGRNHQLLRNWYECKNGNQRNCESPDFVSTTPRRRRQAAPRRRRQGGVPGFPRRRSVVSPRRRGGSAPGGKTKTEFWGIDRVDQRTGMDGYYGADGLTGKGVHVWVVDTGINFPHTDFGGRAIPGIETHEGSLKVCDKGDMECSRDKNEHGSHCAGSACGTQAGVAPGCTLWSAKVMNGRTGYTSRIAAAVDWIAANHKKPALMSMSLGAGGKSVTMKRAINRAKDAGVLAVVAGGNDDDEACKQTPAHVLNATTVGATTSSDTRAHYSNYGECTDIWAPGHRILSAVHNRNSGFKPMSGTSMATPHVAGAAALMLQVNPGMKPLEVDKALKDYATKDVLKGTNIGTGSPNLMLYVTKYTTTSTTRGRSDDSKPKPSRRRNKTRRRKSGGKKKSRRRKSGGKKKSRRRRRKR